MVNWTEWTQNLVEKSMGPYEQVLGITAWALIFTAVIGYVYLKQQSLVAAAVATLVIVAVFVNYMTGVPEWLNMMYIFVALAMAALFVTLFSKRRN